MNWLVSHKTILALSLSLVFGVYMAGCVAPTYSSPPATRTNAPPATKTNANLIVTYYNQARQAYSRQDYPQAINLATKVLQLAPDFTPAHIIRGWAYFATKQYNLAEMDCDRALSLEPGNESALVLKVNFGIRNGNTEQAMAASQKAVSLYPSSALAYSTRGLVYGVKGNLPLAIADIKTSLTLDPDNASTLNNMGWMLLRQGRPSVAISYLDRAVGKNKNANILGSRSWANFFMGNYNAALADCIAAERADPSYTGYRTIRFRVKYIQEGPASASAYLQQEIAYGKSSDQYHKVLEYYCGRRSLDSLKRDPLWLNYDVMTREFGTDQIASLSSADINEPDIPNEGNVSCDLRIVNVASGTVESAASGRAGIHQLESLAKALVKKLKRGIIVYDM